MKINLNFTSKVLACIERYGMIKSSDSVIAAVSGGKDSIAMLYALNALRTKLGFKLSIVHINHMLRGKESHRDACFVSCTADELKLKCTLREVDTYLIKSENSGSMQDIARKIRYSIFSELIKKGEGDKIATAHTKNDQAETVLMRLLRGAGLKGLTGIPPVRDGFIIRPIIDIERWEVEQFLKEGNINWVEDSSNSKLYYLRNSIRFKLIPKIYKEYNPNIISNLTQMSGILRRDEDFIDGYCQNIFSALKERWNEDGRIYISEDLLEEQHPAVLHRIIIKTVNHIMGDVRGVTFKHISNILSLLQKETAGRVVVLPKRLFVRYYNGILSFSRTPFISDRINYFARLFIPGSTAVSSVNGEFKVKIVSADSLTENEINNNKDKRIVFCDLKKTGMNLFVRQRLHGDKFTPLGMRGEKKVKDFFIDEKIPVEMRDRVPIVVNDSKVICWIAGMRLSDKVKVDGGTKDVIILEYKARV